jgi:FixJ family two-component response regulator/signal transduction histidine kinase
VINEEALSVNEEFQSTNEELLTSKEELQSLNEELTALNSQLQETLERQRTTANDMQNVLYSTDVATLFLDTALKIRFFTPATKSLFSVIPTDVGRPLSDLKSLAADGMLLDDARKVMTTRAPLEREIEAENGNWYLRRILPYRTQDDGIEGVVITFVDVTERRRAAEALEAAKREAEAANIAKTRFLAAASHDLRQPVQALALLQGLLAKTVQGDAAKRLVGLLDPTLSAMTTMLNTLLDINQIDAGTVQPRMVDFPIGPLLARLHEEFAVIASAYGLALRLVPCAHVVRTDPHLLEQMLRNLLSNAVKYTKHGRVLLGCRHRGGVLVIQVCDTGIGIPAGELESIFHEYHQVDNAARERSRGLGLGLSIVKRLGDLLGHRITVRSRNGIGSTFSIETEMAQTPGSTPARGPHGGTPSDIAGGTPSDIAGGTPSGIAGGTPSGIAGGTPSGIAGGTPSGIAGGTPSDVVGGTSPQVTGRSPADIAGVSLPEIAAGLEPVSPTDAGGERLAAILLVEDDPDIRDLLKLFLDSQGHAVTAAVDGVEALALVARGRMRPDLILADYNLPLHMNGLQLVAKLRERLHREVPVIILTGDISTETLRDIAAQDCVQLIKPVRPEELAQLIGRLVPPDSVGPAPSWPVASTPGASTPAVPTPVLPTPDGSTPTLGAAVAGPPVIYVVDDDHGVRDSIRRVLQDSGHLVEAFPSCEAFLHAYQPGREACLLLDACLPGMHGIDLLHRLQDAGQMLPAIIITGASDVSMAVQAMKAGALDLIEKPVSGRELLDSVARALEMSHDSGIVTAVRQDAAGHLAGLTARQRQVLDMVLAGYASKNIAATLGISQRTVENHRASIMHRTGTRSVPALARLAMAASWRGSEN